MVLKTHGHKDTAKLIRIEQNEALRRYLARLVGLAHDDVCFACSFEYRKHQVQLGMRRSFLYLFGLFVGYGYKPFKSFFWGLGFILLGTFIFSYGYSTQALTPSKERIYTHECYALDQAITVNEKCAKDWEIINTSTVIPWEIIADIIYTTHLNRYLPWVYNNQAFIFNKPIRLPKGYVNFYSLAYSIDAFVPILDLQQEVNWIANKGWVHWYMWAHIILGWFFTTLFVVGFSGLIKKD